MSAAAPNPNNLIILGLLGIGAYWMLTRRTAYASPLNGMTLQQQQQAAAANQKNTLIATGLTGVMGLISKFAGSSSPAVTPSGAVSGYTADALQGFNLFGTGLGSSGYTPVLDWASSGSDGLALNPAGFTSTFDYASLWGGGN